MKKVSIFIFLISLLLVTGCQKKNALSTLESVNDYLNKNYPNDSFTVQFYSNVTLNAMASTCSSVPGHTWLVTSKNTGISFYVQDDYEFNSFTCEYSLTDNYFDIYFDNKLSEIGDSRIIPYVNRNESSVEENEIGFLSSILGIDLDLNSFASEAELAEFAVNVRQTLLDDDLISNKLPYNFRLGIYEGDSLMCTMALKAADNVDYIINKINEKK